MSVTVFKFGVGRPPVGADRELVLDKITEAHHYRNRLIGIEKNLRANIREIQDKDTVVGPLNRELKELKAKRDWVRGRVGAKFEPRLRVLGAKIRDANKAADDFKPNKEFPTRKALKEYKASLTAEQKTIRAERLKAANEKEASLTAQIHSVSEKLKAAKIKRKATLEKKYNAAQKMADNLAKKAAQSIQDDEKAAELGFVQAYGDPGMTKWWIHKNMKVSFKALRKDMDPDNDPQFETLASHAEFRRMRIAEGALCAGINQTKAANSHRIGEYKTKEKGLLCIPKLPPKKAYSKRTPRGERKRLQRVDVYFRAGTKTEPNPCRPKTNKKTAEWIPLKDVIFHREIPEDAQVLEALLRLEKVGAKTKWFLVLTLDIPEQKQAAPETRMACAVQCVDGRLYPEGLSYASVTSPYGADTLYLNIFPRNRIRRLKGTSECSSEVLSRSQLARAIGERDSRITGVRFNPETGDYHPYHPVLKDDGSLDAEKSEFKKETAMDGVLYLESLKGTRDQLFNTQIPKVLAYMKKYKRLPKPLMEAKESGSLEFTNPQDGKKHPKPGKRRWHELLTAWRENRVKGDESTFKALEYWAYKDYHYYQWICDLNRRLINRKKDEFKKVANYLCRKYACIYLDDKSMEKSNTKINTGNKSGDSTILKWKRHSSFGEFRTTLKSTAKRMGVKIVDADFTKGTAEEYLQLSSVEAAE